MSKADMPACCCWLQCWPVQRLTLSVRLLEQVLLLFPSMPVLGFSCLSMCSSTKVLDWSH